jgi:hypothetical protein
MPRDYFVSPADHLFLLKFDAWTNAGGVATDFFGRIGFRLRQGSTVTITEP